MKHEMLLAIVVALGASPCYGGPAEEKHRGKGLTDANKERLVLDDAADVSAWYNGSPVETTLARSDRHPEGGKFSLKFANVVDYTKGEKNYPIGWPRTGKDLAKAKLTDWSGYDFFECWVYAETSRSSLPKNPLSVGFYHSGPKHSTSLPLSQVRKDAWVKIVIPVSELKAPADVQRFQFNISEADYKHGDRVDLYIADVVLTRFVEPAIAEMGLRRRIVYSNDSPLTVSYRLAGSKGLEEVTVEFEIGRSGDPVAKTTVKGVRKGELSVSPGQLLEPGRYWGRLSLRDPRGKLIDRKQTEFRAIQGPF